MKRVLITGKNSYVGTNVEKWLMRDPDKYYVEMLDMRNTNWIFFDFSKIDVVLHVAALVHQKEKKKDKEMYLKVNRDMTIELAKIAKKQGVFQFIFMSTMAVYGEEGNIGKIVSINQNTAVNPKSFYSISKFEAEIELNKLIEDSFRVVVLRPPMVYGPNCPGNYAKLEKLSIKSPVFPYIDNKRSMLHIEKLCHSVKECIDEETQGLYFPQDDEYVNTSLMVRELAEKNGKSIHLSKAAGIVLKLIGKRVNLINKVFGDLVYAKAVICDDKLDKILFVATIDQHIRHFHYPFLKWFKNNGYEVHVASNGEEELLHVDKKHNIPFERSPFNSNNIKAYKQLKKLIVANDYKLVHCHTPVGGAIARLASISARNRGLKVLYTAHGFHFYKGAPIKNWLIYYPIEKLLSRFTDALITMNKEDYLLANKRNFKAHRVELVRGVGIDLKKFQPQTDRNKVDLRKKHGYHDEDFILIYVGELSYRKHQDTFIRMTELLKQDIPNLKLLLVGEGDYYNEYSSLIDSLEVKNFVHLLGYRRDVPELMMLSDIVVSSSRQEGLPVNVMEAMAVGLPLVVSNCRGNRDLVKHNENGYLFDINNYKAASESVIALYHSKEKIIKFGTNNLNIVDQLSQANILKVMKDIYLDCLK